MWRKEGWNFGALGFTFQKVSRFSFVSIILHCMCSETESTAFYWTLAEATEGDLRMSLLLCCFLFLFLCSSSREMVTGKTRPTRMQLFQMEKGQNINQNLKRHSDGTFTSDYTHFLDKIKAKDFVEWLARTKQERCHEDLFQFAAQV